VERDTLADWWPTWLRRKRDITQGTRDDYMRHWEQRWSKTDLAERKLRAITGEAIADIVADWHESGTWAPKTINNALTVLSTCMKAAVGVGKLYRNPCESVDHVTLEHVEPDYLRPHEVSRYLDGCHPIYRPLAELLIGTGLRISEALALRLSPDLDHLAHGAILVQRTGKQEGEGATKGKRFRRVNIGPELTRKLKERHAWLTQQAPGRHSGYLFPMPVRDGRHGRGRWSVEPGRTIDRTTASRAWHKEALRDAGLRDMRLHCLRHTAAALWLTAPGGSLVFVQRQLGRSSVTTTEKWYGHLEEGFVKSSASAAEALVRDAAAVIGA
jgi:integrase